MMSGGCHHDFCDDDDPADVVCDDVGVDRWAC